MTTAIVAVRDVFVAFRSGAGAIMALRGADLSLSAGERLLVQGPNGSGKTTLLRVITGEQPVLAGTVEVGGTPLHAISAARRRQWRAQSVGFVDQHAGRGLLPELSVLDNVALQLRLAGRPAEQACQQALDTLARLGLGHLRDRRVTQLSGGEAQRVATCAAVAHQPDLVLADEPTGELDDKSAAEVYELLTAVASDGTAVILVSHDSRAARFADRAVRIRDGRAAEQWHPGTDLVAQLPDSRGWVRMPTALLPRRNGLTGLIARQQGAEILLQPVYDGEPAEMGSKGDEAMRGRQPAPAAKQLGSEPLLVLNDLSAGFGDNVLFTGLDLELRPPAPVWEPPAEVPGSWIVVTGPSGSGKSTLLSVVSGLVDPLAGTVAVGGVGWQSLSRDARATHRRDWIALAPQRPGLVEALTVRENLALTAAIRQAASADPEAVAEQLGLVPLLNQPVSLLSGGERQRTSIARCLAAQVPLLVLDEPTSQQDDESAVRTVAALQQEVDAGRSVLVATHDARLIAHADTVIDLSPDGPYAKK
jgi:peptide/nickel transport system ATP-binding protein/energy-coupling factor transport system ATP-binding protein